jgi:HlyD family secretion protein
MGGIATRSYWWGAITGGSGSRDWSHLQLATAVRGPFLVNIQVQGYVDSLKNATLASKVEGTTTIISIVPEGTWVKAGEVVCELDSSSLVDKAKSQEISVTIAESAETEALQGVKITETANQSNIAAAELALKLAQLDLEKYINGEYPQQYNALSGQVQLKAEELVRAEENYEFTRRMSRKGYRNQNDVEAARIAVKKAKLELAAAEEQLNVLETYTKKRTEAELRAKADELVRELDRVKLQAEAEMAKAQKLLQTRQQTLASEREILAKLREQIEACTLRAPQDGQVVYANLDSSSRRSDGSGGIELGAQVRERQAIINLPDITHMKVDCRIHESLIASVREGVPARIRIVSFPDDVFNGKVTAVSSVAMTGRWPNTDLREYRTEITLTDDVEKIKRLRPGLTAMVELLVDSRSDVLQIPIQCIVTVGPHNYVYVMTPSGPERREVRVGLNNTSHMEILEGLQANDRVVQNPRHAFEDEIHKLEAELANKRAAESTVGAVPAETAPAGQAPTRPAGPPNGAAAGEGPRRPGGRPSPDALIAENDKNADGKLSPDEVPPQMAANFAEIDANSDGFITKEELQARFQARAGGGGNAGPRSPPQ